MTLTNLSLNSSSVTGNLVVCVALFCSCNWMQRYAICDFLSLSWTWTVFLLYWLILHSHRCIDAILGKCRFPVSTSALWQGLSTLLKCPVAQPYRYTATFTKRLNEISFFCLCFKTFWIAYLEYRIIYSHNPKGLQVDSVSPNFWT